MSAAHNKTMSEEEKVPETKVQCADCFAWIRRDESHACRQQIRRNRKAEKQ